MSSTLAPTAKIRTALAYPSAVKTFDDNGRVVLVVELGSACNETPEAHGDELRRLAGLGFSGATRGKHAGRQRRIFLGKARRFEARAVAQQLAARGYELRWAFSGKLGRDIERLCTELSAL